jgi:Na+/H+-dicarboxylate symporter
MSGGLDGKALSIKILWAMLFGLIGGLALNYLFGSAESLQGFAFNDKKFEIIPTASSAESSWLSQVFNLILGAAHVGGTIFVNCLKMLVVPLVFVSLVCGTCSLSDPKSLGRIGGKAMGLYLMTTAIAVSVALIFANIFQPGKNSSFPPAEYTAREGKTFMQVLIDMIPTNPINAMAEGNMLQLIIFSILFGISLALVGSKAERIKSIFTELNEVIMKLVTLIMNIAPYGVFCLILKLFTSLGLASITLLLSYFLLVIGVLVLHAAVTYPLLLSMFSGLNPITFLKKMRPTMIFAFSTASSNATIPVTLEAVTKRLGVKTTIGSFTVPLGATINMDGTAIMQGIATVFIANVYGIDLNFTQYLMIIMMATMASIGAAGVPGVGLILLAGVLAQVGLPADGIGLILGIDRLLDMTRTAVNVTGDAAVSSIVAHSEKQLDKDIFDDPNAGLDFENIDVSAK